MEILDLLLRAAIVQIQYQNDESLIIDDISLLFRLTAKKVALAMATWTACLAPAWAPGWRGQDLVWVDLATVWVVATEWVAPDMVATEWVALDSVENGQGQGMVETG